MKKGTDKNSNMVKILAFVLAGLMVFSAIATVILVLAGA